MKVEQLNNVKIDWTKPQVVVAEDGTRMQVVTNQKPNNDLCFCGVDLDTGFYGYGWSKSVFKLETATQYPIELKLTIETPEELCNLLLRLDVDTDFLNENSSLDLKFPFNDTDVVLRGYLSELATERNLYKND